MKTYLKITPAISAKFSRMCAELRGKLNQLQLEGIK